MFSNSFIFQAAVVNIEVATKKATAVPSGSGTALGSMPYFNGMISKFTDDEEFVKALHLLFMGSVGTKGSRKKGLRTFNGFGESTTELQVETKMSDNKKKWTVPILKQAANTLGLEQGGSRGELCKRIAEYAMAPYEVKGEEAVASAKVKIK
jgi:hypothetical protein